VEGNAAADGGIHVGGTGNYVVNNSADYMFFGGPEDGSTGKQPLTNDVIVGNRVGEGGSGDRNSLWISSDTSSKYMNNEVQDYLFAWGGAQNDVEDNVGMRVMIDGGTGDEQVVKNTLSHNRVGIITVQNGASSAAAGGALRHARAAHAQPPARHACSEP
jgi:hypothetical protein